MTSENPPIEVYERIEKSSENVPPITTTSENPSIEEHFVTYLDYPPIEERCGFEDLDVIADGLLVRAPLDQVAELLAQSGVRWERGVYGQTIRGRGLVVFQFRGHAWTGILDGYMTAEYGGILDGYVSDYWNWESQAESLSQKLYTRTIHYWRSDASGSIGYAYWENGTLMERLEYDEEIWEDTHDEALWDAPDRTFEPHLFESQRKQLTAVEIEDAYNFAYDFLCEQHAYAATRFSAFNFQPDDFVRVDYIAFA